jgi:hypothetical protein
MNRIGQYQKTSTYKDVPTAAFGSQIKPLACCGVWIVRNVINEGNTHMKLNGRRSEDLSQFVAMLTKTHCDARCVSGRANATVATCFMRPTEYCGAVIFRLRMQRVPVGRRHNRLRN